MFKFSENEVVVLTEEYPLAGLKPGDTGVVWAFYNTTPPSYEVTFKGEDGRDFDIAMSEDELTAVPSQRELAYSA